jgi:sigma-E factor negative regulatory protein RseC
MIEETGQVVEVQGDFAWIESERSSTCGGCSVRNGCGTAALARVLGQRRVRLRVLNHINARVGDTVVVGIAESGLVRGSLAVYVVPLAAFLGGALTGQFLGDYFFAVESDIAAISGAAAGLVAGLAWLKRFSRATATDASFQPVILRRQIMTVDL